MSAIPFEITLHSPDNTLCVKHQLLAWFDQLHEALCDYYQHEVAALVTLAAVEATKPLTLQSWCYACQEWKGATK